LNKANIALKEANELCYWLELLQETNYITKAEFDSIHTDGVEMIKLLTAIVKTTKANLKR
jgi:four helix bundle protein